ncbi:MAG: hypothetical protein MJZ30_06790 [Paludibacteraceae bacterium]|nr:hypothetical protein [Paludibacteraceae bacterium]
MKTRFFFPVVAMIAFATVTNAAAFKLGGNTPRVEVASVEKVDARAGVETSVLGTSLSGLTSGLACGAEVARRMDAGAETSVCGAGQKGIMAGFECGAEKGIQVVAGVDSRIDI